MQAPPPHLLAHCPVCHAAYPVADIQFVGEKGSARLFHCTCVSCRNAILAVVLESGDTLSSVGLVTDLDGRDALRFYDALPLTTEECVAFHRFLEEGSKNFCRDLLKGRKA